MIGLVILLFFTAVQTSQSETPTRSKQLTSLVETELAFARTCKEIGIRASFVKFFADDGIAFKPEPFRYKDVVKDLPSPANPKALLLEWGPDVADIAASGELGYTTGPSVRSDNAAKDKPEVYGQFFSVWKKQKGGAWKVVVDIGTQTPSQTAPLGTPFKDRKVVSAPATNKKWSDDQAADMMNLEREFTKSSASDGVVKAYVARVADDARLHRENKMPIVGRDAIQAHLSKQSVVPTWSPIAGDVSVAGDLGYTYGSYECKTGNSSIAEKGYYLHVWRRNEQGEWRLVADIENPQTPDKGK
jgi:ketosteroid isomerase-like protein